MLEAIARGDSVDIALEEHVAFCSSCKQSIDEIRDNNSFLELFAGEISNIESNELDTAIDAPLPEILPGGYRVEYEIHRGGHGVVYRATQIRTKRSVAVKMLILGSSASERQQSRFEREAEIIASLRHPGIVTIYDAGRLKDGRFGFAMEFIDGLTLDLWGEQRRIESKDDIRNRLALFFDICEAVRFAHQNGVVHRDLKPANILVDKLNKPHILDFGIAKALEPVGLGSIASIGAKLKTSSRDAESHQTQPGEFAGTLAYASPEQVSGDPRSIDMRTDVYSLGIILYQLMTGQFPYEVDDSLQSVIHRIKNEIPNSPSAQAQFLDKDIDEIVLRALQKDKNDRYASVADLHRDIQLYLDGRPIEARRDSAWYVLNKTVRRHWMASSISLVSLILLAAFATMMTVLYTQKAAAEVDALLQLRARNISHAHTEELLGDGALALNLLWGAQLESNPGLPPPEAAQFGEAFEPLDSYWELWSFYSRNPCLKSIEFLNDWQQSSAMNAEGSLMAVFNEGKIELISLPEFESVRVLSMEFPPEFSSKEKLTNLAISTDQKSILALTTNGIVHWDIDDGSLIKIQPFTNSDSINTATDSDISLSMALHSHHKLLSPHGLLAGIFQTTVWGVRLSDPSQVFTLNSGNIEASTFQLNAEGNLLATSAITRSNYTSDRTILNVWSIPDITLLGQIETDGFIVGLVFSPNSQELIWSDGSSSFFQWDYASTKTPTIFTATGEVGTPHCWFGDPLKMATTKSDEVIIFNKNLQSLQQYSGHSNIIGQVVAPAGLSTLVSFDFESAMVWETKSRAWEDLAILKSDALQDVAISPDGQRIAWTKSVSGIDSVIITNLKSNDPPIELIEPRALVNTVSFGHTGQLLASAGFDGVIFVWDTHTGTVRHKFTEHSSSVHSVSMSPTANTLASGGDDHKVVLRDLDTGLVRILNSHADRVPSVAFSPDGRLLASCDSGGGVRLWNVRTGDLRKAYEFEDRFHALCFSPDGVTLAVGGEAKSVIFIDINTDKHSVLQEEPGAIFALAFGPVGKVLVSGDKQGNLSLWDVEHKNRLTRFFGHHDMIMSIAVSSDGRSMATCSTRQDPELRYWDLTAFAPHIAGNLEYHADKITKANEKKPANLDAMRRWADEIRGSD